MNEKVDPAEYPHCAQCNKQHIAYDGTVSCKAHRNSMPDQPCGRLPMFGLDVCDRHGGKTPNAVAKSRIARENIRLSKLVLGSHPTRVDPVAAIHEQIFWSQTHVDWYRAQVQKLVPDALVWGETEIRDADLQGLSVVQRAEVNAWLKLYNGERERLVNWCARAVHAGLAEREVRISEQLGGMLLKVIQGILGDLQLSQEQVEVANTSVPRHLKAVASRTSA